MTSFSQALSERQAGASAPVRPSGSSTILNLTPVWGQPAMRTISAIQILARNGIPLREAKHAIEAVIDYDGADVTVYGDHVDAIAEQLAGCGFIVRQR